MQKDKSGKKDMAPELKMKDLEKNESMVGTHVGAFVSGKKYVTKMKSLKKILVQTHDSYSYANEHWVTFIESGGWSGD